MRIILEADRMVKITIVTFIYLAEHVIVRNDSAAQIYVKEFHQPHLLLDCALEAQLIIDNEPHVCIQTLYLCAQIA